MGILDIELREEPYRGEMLDGEKIRISNKTKNQHKQVVIRDIRNLPAVIIHPALINIEHFMSWYARHLQLDYLKYPNKYHGVAFKTIYYRMAKEIINGTARLSPNNLLEKTCHSVGIPPTYPWIRSYIFFDQIQIKQRMSNKSSRKDYKTQLDAAREIQRELREQKLEADAGQRTGTGEISDQVSDVCIGKD